MGQGREAFDRFIGALRDACTDAKYEAARGKPCAAFSWAAGF